MDVKFEVSIVVERPSFIHIKQQANLWLCIFVFLDNKWQDKVGGEA
jgi:hypothetical protein